MCRRSHGEHLRSDVSTASRLRRHPLLALRLAATQEKTIRLHVAATVWQASAVLAPTMLAGQRSRVCGPSRGRNGTAPARASGNANIEHIRSTRRSARRMPGTRRPEDKPRWVLRSARRSEHTIRMPRTSLGCGTTLGKGFSGTVLPEHKADVLRCGLSCALSCPHIDRTYSRQAGTYNFKRPHRGSP